MTFRIVAVASLLGGYHPGRGEVRLGLPAMCLDDRGNGTAKGNPVQAWSCTDDLAQRWTFQPGGEPGGTGELRLGPRCLAIEGQARQPGSVVGLWPCTGYASQQWLITGETGELYNPAAGMCLDAPGGTVSGRQADITPCRQASQQAWTLPASPVMSGIAGKCLADGGARISTCDGSSRQKFTLGLGSTIEIAGKCLSVAGGSASDGTAVQPSDCDGRTSEVFRVSAFGQLHNPASGKCLADPGNSAANGTHLVIEDCYGLPGEIWAVS